MGWTKTNPTNSGLLINFPAQCRENWDAIELGTDSALLVTNVKVHSSAGIVENKITFSGTGHGHTGSTDGKQVTLTTAVSGVLPVANGGTGSNQGVGFITGDLIVSTVTTVRTGWTNVSSTYSNKFIRINATPLTTGGADMHSHTLAEVNIPAHTHSSGSLAIGNESSHKHQETWPSGGGYISAIYGEVGTGAFTVRAADSTLIVNYPLLTAAGSAHTHTVSGSTGSIGSTTAFTGDNVPAYVQVCVFQKD